MDDLRRPFFLAAFACLLLAVGLEWGASWTRGALDTASAAGVQVAASPGPPPGRSIPALGLLDLLLVIPLTWMVLSLVLSHAVLGRVQPIATLVASLIILFVALFLVFRNLGELLLMVGLLLAVPFGTIAYFATYASFPVGASAALLSAGLLFKIACCALLVAAQQRFLTVKSLVVLALVSLLCSVLVSFLHGFPPRFLASITDAIGAIVVGIVALLFAIVTLIGSIIGTVRAVRSLA
ncbi:MAG: hypothetical protein QNK03_22195 [Myxococcota bacterium]|nr:hypothetical protein [Myxococcota bacterium]